ncbi:MAG: zinc ribbon domain-containing protein [Candidatus Latescibacterota bacterium]
MALFEYRCKSCGKISEILKQSDDDAVSCSFCGSEDMEKLLSTFAVSMKSPSAKSTPPGCPGGGCCGGQCGF